MSALSSCLKEEANAIASLEERLCDDQVEKALFLLEDCSIRKAKLIVSGVGKSGIVARKIAATFSSIGLTSIYLNPLDALHGDLGIVAEKDVCLLLSNSGETKDILELLPHLKRRSIFCIALVGDKNCSIARQCDVSLEAGVDKEVCPLNLAPTASTAAAMAVGDALASVWMERRGVSLNDFAFNHPAGSLGKQLTLKTGDLMLPVSSLTPISKDLPFTELIVRITQDGIGSGWVEDTKCKGKLLGLITDGDVRRALIANEPRNWVSLNAKDLMTLDPITLGENVLAIDAIKCMEKNIKKPVSVIPIVSKSNEMLGLLRLHDLVNAGL